MRSRSTPTKRSARRWLRWMNACLTALFIVFVSGLSFWFYQARANQPQVTISLNADAYTVSSEPTKNFGRNQYLKLATTPNTISFIRLEVTGADQRAIERATLRLYNTDPSKQADLKFFSVNPTWDEKGIVWNNQPALGAQVAELPAMRMVKDQWIEVDLTRAITGNGIYSFGITTNSDNSIGFGARTLGNAPQLILTMGTGSAAPTPTTAPTETAEPVIEPTDLPAATATAEPTATTQPTAQPTNQPTNQPTVAPTNIPVPPAQNGGGNTYYVSKQGNGSDGKSWATAWNELDRINWSIIRPGDTILLDGGASEMQYTSILAPTVNGTADKPIIIRLASEAGRDGKVVIFGGRSIPLPYCSQFGYSGSNNGGREAGIVFSERQWIVVDGGKWRGITIHGHSAYGIRVRGTSSNIRVRNVEIFDNGAIRSNSDGSAYPDQKGVALGGSNITFERAIVHDNGQDAFQSAGVHNFALRQSWVYNSRTDPKGDIFNRCRHQDGLQIYNGGEVSGILIEESVFGPGLMHGTILGQTPDANGNQATVSDVTIRNSLFYRASNVNIMGYPGIASKRWTIENVTSYRIPGARWHNIMLEGGDHRLINSVFVGGYLMTLSQAGLTNSNNCQAEISGGVTLASGTIRFANLGSDDYALQSASGCAGKGSSITSANQLLSLK